MTKPRTPASAENALAEATDQIIQDGSIIHKDGLWEAAEMALDGASKESIPERIKKARSEVYQPMSGWRRGGK